MKQSYKENNFCKKCKNKKEQLDKLFCNYCLEKYNNRIKKTRKQKFDNGNCQVCNKKREFINKKWCNQCLKDKADKTKLLRQERRDNNLCTACGLFTPVKNIDSCVDCWFKTIAVKYLRDSKKYYLLKEKFNSQNNRCYYSNIFITIGINASIEHKESKSKNPNKIGDLDNLVFVDLSVNRMKNKLNEEEFIPHFDKICKERINFQNKKIHKEIKINLNFFEKILSKPLTS